MRALLSIDRNLPARAGVVACTVLMLVTSGCGDDGDKPGAATPTPPPTVTPTPIEDVHVEIFIASTEPEAGALVGALQFDRSIPLFFNTCFGSEDEDCHGGTALYSSVNPGIEPLAEDDPQASLYTVAEGTPVSLEVTAINAALSLRIGETTLDGVGDSVLLGEAPDFHADAEAQLTLPGGEGLDDEYSISLKLNAPEYPASEEFTVTYFPVTAMGHDHEDGD